MITLEKDSLKFQFPEIHPDASCEIDFVKTLRVPDDGKEYPLPPGLEAFPLRHLDDYSNNLPEHWQERGGVIAPIYQCEALWLSFSTGFGESGGVPYPFAIKVGTGKINAVTGEDWRGHLNQSPQDYVVVPEQPWIDGYCVRKGVVRQFVAAPLGEGYTVGEQLSGQGKVGGLQLSVWPMKQERYLGLVEESNINKKSMIEVNSCLGAEMGLAPGGSIRQKIYDDRYGLDAWDQRNCARVFVSLLNSTQWIASTGERPPGEPMSASDYTKHGLPWFDYYDADAKALEGAKRFGLMSSVRETDQKKRKGIWPSTKIQSAPRVVNLGTQSNRPVREAEI